MNKTCLSVGLFDTLFDSALPRIPYGKSLVMKITPNALGVLTGFSSLFHRMYILGGLRKSYNPFKICLSLHHVGLVPFIVRAEDVRFWTDSVQQQRVCSLLHCPLIHIDSNIDVLNKMDSLGVPHKILFVGVHDERAEHKEVSFEGVHIARDWDEVGRIIRNITTPE